MNKDTCDRIIVESNAKMLKVINWYLDNRDRLDAEKFRAPISCGCIELQEEQIEVTFESQDEDDVIIEIAVYPLGISTAALTFNYNTSNGHASHYRLPMNISKQKRDLMWAALEKDRTDAKEALKYHALMRFSTHYEDIVTVDESRTTARTKHEAKKIRQATKSRKPVPLVRRTYVIEDFETEQLKKPGEKRHYTKPDHEVSVKGYYRTLKSGRRVWVRPCVKYKDKGDSQRKEYTV